MPNNSGRQLIFLASTMAIAISQDLNADETNILANFISALGDNLAIIAATKQTDTAQQSDSSDQTDKEEDTETKDQKETSTEKEADEAKGKADKKDISKSDIPAKINETKHKKYLDSNYQKTDGPK